MSDQPDTKAPRDLSPRVVDLARAIDHLPPGTYELTIEKQPAPLPWNVTISQPQTVKVMTVGVIIRKEEG